MMKLSSRGRVLAVLLVLYILFDILLTPLGGLESRPSTNVTTVGYVTVSLLFVGLALSLVSLIMLFYKPRRSPLVAIIRWDIVFSGLRCGSDWLLFIVAASCRNHRA